MTILDHRCVTSRARPAEPGSIPEEWRRTMPEHCATLAISNGFELHNGLVRVFGHGSSSPLRDAVAWNRSNWRTAYRLQATTILWGENIFGDQLGLDTNLGAVVALSCEGGALELLPYGSPTEYIEGVLLKEPREWIEIDLVTAAYRRGLRPSFAEHLSFELPLMCGGAPDEGNLEVLDASAHLEILGQLVEQSRKIAPGTPIRGFNG